jgi:hypothetical protein
LDSDSEWDSEPVHWALGLVMDSVAVSVSGFHSDSEPESDSESDSLQDSAKEFEPALPLDSLLRCL